MATKKPTKKIKDAAAMIFLCNPVVGNLFAANDTEFFTSKALAAGSVKNPDELTEITREMVQPELKESKEVTENGGEASEVEK